MESQTCPVICTGHITGIDYILKGKNYGSKVKNDQDWQAA